ncbi:hypothetical protein [Draconibacterium sp.]|uniref:hypothetical protein n=1 Tax=Draconibacterium sp. TaxID=1965318 RepID=UPI003562BF6F
MDKVISFLENNGFEKLTDNNYWNDTCNVKFQDGGGYAVSDKLDNTMYSIDNNIYWLIGVLTYYGFIDKNYVDI